MSLIAGLRHRLRVLLRPRAYQRELDEEHRFHLTLEAMQQSRAAGTLSPADAALAARRRFGNRTLLIEETRRMNGLGFFDTLGQDLRFALKSFGRTPGFTVVAVLTLAIGIGANTAIFSAVNALLLRPLPFVEPERLMSVGMTVPARNGEAAREGVVWSYPKFTVFRSAQTVYSDLALSTVQQATMTVAGEADRVQVEYAGARYLPMLGVRPALGRGFLPEEDEHPGSAKVALLSDALWKRRFNADPGIAGKPLMLSGDPYVIVGVLPEGFGGLTGRADLMVPIMSKSAEDLGEAWNHSYSLVARLKPGVSVAHAIEVTKALGSRVDAAFPNPEVPDEHWGTGARPLDATRVDPVVRRSLLVLLGAVGLVLLIACANVANLFLARASGRRREIAVRLAVGAGRGRLIRQLLTESLVLSGLGGVASLALAWWGVRMLSAINPASALRTQGLGGLGVIKFASIHLDMSAFWFAVAVTLATGVLFGLIPALQATHPALTEELKEGNAPPPRRRVWRALTSRNVLAATELALALVLLAGSGLMVRSLGKLLSVNPGFDAGQVLTIRMNASPNSARDSLPAVFDQILERLRGLPGVVDAALTDCPPLNGGCNGTAIAFRDRPPPAPGTEPDVGVHWITPAWSTVLQVPLLKGRLFSPADRLGARKVVVLNETAARRFWPGEEAVGRPVSIGQGGFWNDTAYVVGIVADVRFGTIDSLPKPDAYLSYYQSPRSSMMILLRTSANPTGVASAARQVLHEILPEAPIYDIRTLESRVAEAMSYARFSATLLAMFGLVALALATVGTYGVISFGVAQRTREIGIRVALGAARSDIMRLVIGQGMALAAVGAGIGLGAALVLTRVMRSLLYGVAPSDPATFVVIVGLLVAASAIASWIPARRAARVDAVTSLKTE